MTETSATPTRPAVVDRDDPGYDDARRAWNLLADLRPDGVVEARTVEDVVAAVRLAARRGLRIAAQGTGHFATTLPALDGTLLLRTALQQGPVEIDPLARTARVHAGATWGEVVDAAGRHGLAALHGSSPSVGVVGYLLGGGLSFYARRHGLAADHVRAIELVTPDGEHRRVDATTEPDLFWALRGGGGAFGVVTAVELGLLPIREVFAGTAFWPVADAAAVVRAWVRWTRSAPVGITTSLRILCLPPVDDVPEPLRGVPVVAIDGALIGGANEGNALLAPLRAAAEPLIDTWGMLPAPALVRVHGDPEHPVPATSAHAVLHDLDGAAIDAFLAVTGEGSGSPLVWAELRQLGGALASRTGGATGPLPGRFLLFAGGLPFSPEHGRDIDATLARLTTAMEPWTSGRHLNFGEDGGSAEPCFSPVDYERLRTVRAAWDPARMLVGSHAIS